MFRFSIRELLLVTTIAALTTGWLLDHQRLVTQERNLMSAVASVVQTLSQDQCNLFNKYYALRRQSDPTIEFDDLYTLLFGKTTDVEE